MLTTVNHLKLFFTNKFKLKIFHIKPFKNIFCQLKQHKIKILLLYLAKLKSFALFYAIIKQALDLADKHQNNSKCDIPRPSFVLIMQI